MSQDAYDSQYVCEVLGKQHDRKRFDCGVSILNDYLARVANQDVKRKAAAVFVMAPANDKQRIAGFYTKQGFLELPNMTNRLFLPIATAETLF